jgi:hypothetical protein
MYVENENGIKYYPELPNDFIKLPSFKELFKTNNNDKVLTTENAELRIDLELILFNPQTNEYYPRWIHHASDKEQLFKYYKDGNLYINKNDLIWSTKT